MVEKGAPLPLLCLQHLPVRDPSVHGKEKHNCVSFHQFQTQKQQQKREYPKDLIHKVTFLPFPTGSPSQNSSVKFGCLLSSQVELSLGPLSPTNFLFYLYALFLKFLKTFSLPIVPQHTHTGAYSLCTLWLLSLLTGEFN